MADGGRRVAELERQVGELRAALAEAEARLAAVLSQHESEAATRQQLAAIVEASRDAIWSWSADGTVTAWNAEAERLLQYSPGEIVGKSLLTLVPPERRKAAREVMAQLGRGGWYGQYETVRLRKDGTPVQVELTVSPIRNSAGAIVGAATVCRDITERKQIEARQNLLMRELDHRVKNTIATVLALMQQTRRNSRTMEAFSRDFEERLRTLVRTHDALMKNHFVGASLQDLVRQELRAFCPEGSSALTLTGDDMLLNWRSAQMVCLAVHELAANAARHGALSVSEGRVWLTWQVDHDGGEPQVRLEWREGGGPPVDPRPPRRGFGRSLLERGLASALSGSAMLEFTPQGLRYELSFPVRENVVGEGTADGLELLKS